MDKLAKTIGFKLLLIVALFTVIVNIAHAEEDTYKNVKPPLDAQEIFDNLQFAAGGASQHIKFSVNTNPILNAYMDSNNNLVVFLGALNFSLRDRNDKDMLAGIIGHEIGHKMLGHVGLFSNCNKDPAHSRDCEREADKYGIELMWRAGYDCDGDARFYSEVIKTWGGDDSGPYSSHPSDKERLNWSTRACKALKTTGQGIPVDYETKDNI